MPKLRHDFGRELDATFSVEPTDDTLAVYVESRGGGRNAEYAQGLELLLQRLGSYPAVIANALLASRGTQSLPELERRIEIDGYPFPIDPRLIDIVSFRLAFGAAQSRSARQADATGSGNPTKRVQLVLTFPNGAVPAPMDLERHLSGRVYGTGGVCWALCANPKTYRILDAVRALESDWWTTKGKQMTLGDRVVIWQAQGGGDRRGVVALGEVVSGPRESADAGNPFWVKPADADVVEERVEVRYVVPPRMPLWLGQPGNEFLDDLAVARARGGTVFDVTPEQWNRIVAAAGGWDGEWNVLHDASAEETRQSRGQGGGLTPAERRAVEEHAMARAKAYFESRQIRWHDVHERASYDLHCFDGTRELYVEVKGTITHGETISLTFNEVELAANRYPNTVLFVTSAIDLNRQQQPPVASGGRDRIIEQWRPSPKTLRPIRYECTLGVEYGRDVTQEATVATTAISQSLPESVVSEHDG